MIEAEYFLLVVLGDIGKSMPELFKGAMRKDETLNMYLYLVECKLYKYRPARTTTRAGKHYVKKEYLSVYCTLTLHHVIE